MDSYGNKRLSLTKNDTRAEQTAARSLLRRALVYVATLSLCSFIAVLSVLAYKSVSRSSETFSAVWLTHDMLVAYMSHTNGNWPSDWDDLDPYFNSSNQGYGLPDLKWVRNRVDINFNFETTSLNSSIAVQDNALSAMRMSDGSENGELRNANERIRLFAIKLRSQSSTP